jgi:triosephosphate isomerase
MRPTIIAGNWKMNGTIAETETLLNGLLKSDIQKPNIKIVVCPPYTSLFTAGKLLSGSNIILGAQDMSVYDNGAYTSEISGEMLLTVGVGFVILGHSERRQYHFENDELVNAKAKTAFKYNLTPIICVGETLEQREDGQTEEIVKNQVLSSLIGFSTEELKKLVIAYEPVWAIGTGKTATPEMAQDVHSFIRDILRSLDESSADMIPILYGGSVKPSNSVGLMSQQDIDGALVGGASLVAEDFIGIINSV